MRDNLVVPDFSHMISPGCYCVHSYEDPHGQFHREEDRDDYYQHERGVVGVPQFLALAAVGTATN